MNEQQEMVNVQEKRSFEEALERESWVAPLVDIYETSDEYVILANMPGVAKDEVKIKLEDGNLVLMGLINFEEAKGRKYTLKETETGNYYRKFKISDGVDESKISANLEEGVLKVILPKHERVKPKTIEIK